MEETTPWLPNAALPLFAYGKAVFALADPFFPSKHAAIPWHRGCLIISRISGDVSFAILGSWETVSCALRQGLFLSSRAELIYETENRLQKKAQGTTTPRPGPRRPATTRAHHARSHSRPCPQPRTQRASAL